MAGPQGKAMAINSHCARKNVNVDGFKPYAVPDKNKPPSTVYFNQVKKRIQETMPGPLKTWQSKYGVENFWSMVYEEMTKYTYDFEGNQAIAIYMKYKGDLNDTKEKSSG